MEKNCKGIKEAMNLVWEEFLCSKRHQDKEWISIGTLGRIQEKKNKEIRVDDSWTRAGKLWA